LKTKLKTDTVLTKVQYLFTGQWHFLQPMSEVCVFGWSIQLEFMKMVYEVIFVCPQEELATERHRLVE